MITKGPPEGGHYNKAAGPDTPASSLNIGVGMVELKDAVSLLRVKRQELIDPHQSS